MRSSKPLFDVFEKALGKLKQGECVKDADKDGFYRCIYAYRNSYDMPLTSRAAAIELLTEVSLANIHFRISFQNLSAGGVTSFF